MVQISKNEISNLNKTLKDFYIYYFNIRFINKNYILPSPDESRISSSVLNFRFLFLGSKNKLSYFINKM